METTDRCWESIDIDDIPESGQHKVKSNWRNVVKDFLESGEPAAKVVRPQHHYNPASLRSCVSNAVYRLNLEDEIQVVSRKNEVFMIRKDAIE